MKNTNKLLNGILSPEGVYHDCGDKTHYALVTFLGLDWLDDDDKGWVVIESGIPFIFDGCRELTKSQLKWIYDTMKFLEKEDQDLINKKLTRHFEIQKQYKSSS